MKGLLAIFAAIALSACSHGEKLSDQPGVAASQIKHWVPLGTAARDALRDMRQHGFVCSTVTNGTFGHVRGVDYLYCGRSSGGIVHRRWQAALVLIDGKVSEVQVTTGLVGP